MDWIKRIKDSFSSSEDTFIKEKLFDYIACQYSELTFSAFIGTGITGDEWKLLLDGLDNTERANPYPVHPTSYKEQSNPLVEHDIFYSLSDNLLKAYLGGYSVYSKEFLPIESADLERLRELASLSSTTYNSDIKENLYSLFTKLGKFTVNQKIALDSIFFLSDRFSDEFITKLSYYSGFESRPDKNESFGRTKSAYDLIKKGSLYQGSEFIQLCEGFSSIEELISKGGFPNLLAVDVFGHEVPFSEIPSLVSAIYYSNEHQSYCLIGSFDDDMEFSPNNFCINLLHDLPVSHGNLKVVIDPNGLIDLSSFYSDTIEP